MSAEKNIGEYRALKADRSEWDSRWIKLMDWFVPHRSNFEAGNNNAPNTSNRSKLHDTHSIGAAYVLTSAHMSYITPLNDDWLGYTAPRSLRKKLKESGDLDVVNGYFKECSEIAMEAIATSNFYTAIHSLYKDRTIIGTGAMMLKKGKNGVLNFQYVPVSCYCFNESEDGLPNEFFREYELTLAQAVDEFGEENLGSKLSDELKQTASKPELLHVKHPFLHVVRERKERDVKKDDNLNMVYQDLNICLTDQKILREGGFQEFPYLVSRYERWGNYLWGFSPASNALPNTLSANYIRKILKTLGEVAAFPRILMLAGEKSQIDLSAAGKTVVSRASAQLGYPREWGTSGRFDVGEALIRQDHGAIDQFFHVHLFQMFANIDKEMTATEVGAREREKLLMFAPSFTQFVTDMTPMMVRVFSMLAREGAFPDPPDVLMEDAGDGEAIIPTPEVVFQSKVALAIKSLQGEGFDRLMQRLMALIQVQPDIIDNFDLDSTFRDMARNEAIPENWLRIKKEVDGIREQRAQAAAEQEKAIQAEQMTKMIGNAGGPEGVQQLSDMAEGGEQ